MSVIDCLVCKDVAILSVIDCPVCKDVAIAHFHYGGMCCYSCKAFFRRVVNTSKVFIDFFYYILWIYSKRIEYTLEWNLDNLSVWILSVPFSLKGSPKCTNHVNVHKLYAVE